MDVPVQAIREALAKATPGEWHRVEDVHIDATVTIDGDPLWVGELERVSDAELIVLLRNNAEALLDAAEKWGRYTEAHRVQPPASSLRPMNNG